MPPSRDFACLLLSTIIVAFAPHTFAQERPAAMPQLTREVLTWMPVDSESIAVAGAFSLRSQKEVSRFEPLYPAKTATWTLRSIATGPLHGLEGGEYLEILEGTRVRVAIAAGRRFKLVNSFGARSYQGCHAILTSGLAEKGDLFVEALREDAESVTIVEGHETFVFDTIFPNQVWAAREEWEGVFITRPDPHVILCATQQDFLAEVLRRRAQTRVKHSLLNRSELWPHVDHSAKSWLVRQVAGECAEHCTINLRPGGRNELQVTYRPTPESPDRVQQLADSRWDYAEVGLKPRFAKPAGGSAVVSLSFEPAHEQVSISSGQMLAFLLGFAWGDDFVIRRTRKTDE